VSRRIVVLNAPAQRWIQDVPPDGSVSTAPSRVRSSVSTSYPLYDQLRERSPVLRVRPADLWVVFALICEFFSDLGCGDVRGQRTDTSLDDAEYASQCL
jgi:hypothetical protein